MTTIEPITVGEYVEFPIVEFTLKYSNIMGETFFEIVRRDPKTDINWLATGDAPGLHTNIDTIVFVFASELTLTPVVMSTSYEWTPYK